MNNTSEPLVSLQARYVNRINGKTYVVLSERNGIVAFQQENRYAVWHLGRDEFNRRLTPADPTPAPSSHVQVEFDLCVTGTNINSEYIIALRFKGEQFFEGFSLGRYDTMNRQQIALLDRIRDMYPRVSAALSIPLPQPKEPPVPQLWAECGYCKHAGEECLHRVDELRWNGEQWCCAECTGDDDRNRWEASPRIAPQTNTKLDPTAVFHREMTEAEVDHATELVFAIRRLAVGKTVDEIVSALVATTSALVCENAPSRTAAKSYWRTFHKQMIAVIDEDFDKFIQASQVTRDVTTSEGV